MNSVRPHHQSSASGGRRGFRPAFVDDLAFNSWGIAYFVLATIVKATGLWQHMHDSIHIAFLQGEVAYRKALLEYCEWMGPGLMMNLPGVFEDAEIKGCPRISRLIKDLNGEDYFERLEAERLASNSLDLETGETERRSRGEYEGAVEEPPQSRTRVASALFYSPLLSAPARNMGLVASGPDTPILSTGTDPPPSRLARRVGLAAS